MTYSVRWLMLAVITMTLGGCVTPPPQKNVDYSAFRASDPASILVLPPLNTSVEPDATNAVLAQTTFPLAESGYYVIPVGVMHETFSQNGLHSAEDIHQVPHKKLHDIFGADTALYMTVSEYGTSYQIVDSVTTVSLDATLVDLRTGTTLWNGATSIRVGNNKNNNSLLGLLLQAVVSQIVNTTNDRSYAVAGTANNHLLFADPGKGLLYGPRSPRYDLQHQAAITDETEKRQ
jgi:hypothetical protein